MQKHDDSSEGSCKACPSCPGSGARDEQEMAMIPSYTRESTPEERERWRQKKHKAVLGIESHHRQARYGRVFVQEIICTSCGAALRTMLNHEPGISRPPTFPKTRDPPLARRPCSSSPASRSALHRSVFPPYHQQTKKEQ